MFLRKIHENTFKAKNIRGMQIESVLRAVSSLVSSLHTQHSYQSRQIDGRILIPCHHLLSGLWVHLVLRVHRRKVQCIDAKIKLDVRILIHKTTKKRVLLIFGNWTVSPFKFTYISSLFGPWTSRKYKFNAQKINFDFS